MKDDTSFAEQWQAALTLAEVRGWRLSQEGGVLRVMIYPEEPLVYVYPRDPAGLAALLDELQRPDDRGKFKAIYRHAHGFTDPRAIYGTTTTS